jgi:hypothetical protein
MREFADHGNQTASNRPPSIDVAAPVTENKYSLPNSGPVAQLGARFHGMEEVIGSIPIRSTN